MARNLEPVNLVEQSESEYDGEESSEYETESESELELTQTPHSTAQVVVTPTTVKHPTEDKSKEKEGKLRNLYKSHEEKCYQLSKEFWDIVSEIHGVAVEDQVKKVVEGGNEWKELKLKQMELHLSILQVQMAQVKRAVKVMRG